MAPTPRAVRAAAAILLLAVTVAACTKGGGSPEVTVTMDEYSLSVEPDVADAGRVRIFIDNEGEQEHGLVFAYAEDAAALPLTPEGTVDVNAINVADRLEPVGPGRYRIDPNLRAGRMVVFCNLVTEGPDGQPVSHFQQGMHTRLDVTGEDPTSDTSPPPGAVG